jgi:micrococcal nuclease
MRRRIRYIVSLIVLATIYLAASFFKNINSEHHIYADASRDYTVSRVIDGDTIQLSNGRMVRYIGIDTPETREKIGSKWVYEPKPYAEEAAAFNKKLVEGKAVKLEFDVQKTDKYNRFLSYAYVDNKMVNAEIVREGLAMLYTYPPNVKYTKKFLEAQKEARDNKRGLWTGLEENKISTSQAKNNIGMVRMIESEVIDTYLTEKVLILKFKDNFKVVIYRNNILPGLEDMARSPNKYFKGKTVKVYGIIKEYKGYPEIALHDMSQLEILKN